MSTISGRELLIIGAGHQGISMAAHFSLNGESVNLWNRTEANIMNIICSRRIRCDGIVRGDAIINKASSDIDELISDTIFITTPSTAHKDIAQMLASRLVPNSFVFLNPGRTFGAVEFLNTLRENSCVNIPTVIETQSIVYTCRKFDLDSAYIYALKDNVKMAACGCRVLNDEILSRIPICVRSHFRFADSILETSLGNVGMILHCAPVLMNIGWIESDIHKFSYYYDGISRTICDFLEKIDQERVNVAKALGVRVLTLVEWFNDTYDVDGESIFECIRNNEYYRNIDAPTSIHHRYLDEDIPNGLVPIEYIGIQLGVNVSNISLIIDLAEAVTGNSYRQNGRRFDVDCVLKSIN